MGESRWELLGVLEQRSDIMWCRLQYGLHGCCVDSRLKGEGVEAERLAGRKLLESSKGDRMVA